MEATSFSQSLCTVTSPNVKHCLHSNPLPMLNEEESSCQDSFSGSCPSIESLFENLMKFNDVEGMENKDGQHMSCMKRLPPGMLSPAMRTPLRSLRAEPACCPA